MVEAIRQAFRDKHRRVMLESPTGSGKTIVFSYIAKRMLETGKRATIFVHRRELVHQTSAKLSDMGVPHGVIAPDYHPQFDMNIQVAAIQTVGRRGLDLAADLFIVDEAHHAVSPTWSRVLSLHPGKSLLVTATPERLDGKGLRSEADILLHGPDMRDLIDQGFLADYTALSHPPDQGQLAKVKVSGGDYRAPSLGSMMSEPVIVGDAVHHYEQHLSGRSAILFSPTVAHAELMAETFKQGGHRAACIHGKLPQTERDQMTRAIADRQLDVLTSCELISEGFDVPEVGGVILMRPTKSLALHLQQVGRALRPKENGQLAVILDHAGNLVRPDLGPPDLKRAWSLDGAKARKEAEEKQNTNRKVSDLSAADPRTPYAVIDGQLVPMVKGSKDWIFAHGTWTRALEQCETRADFERMGKLRGYKKRWARTAWLQRLAKDEDDPVKRRILTSGYPAALALCNSDDLLRYMQEKWGFRKNWLHMARRQRS